MAIFVVFRVTDPIKMGSVIAAAFPGQHLAVKSDEWLISSAQTVKEVSDKLNLVPDGPNGAAIVFSMANYFGTADPGTWEWIKTRMVASSG